MGDVGRPGWVPPNPRSNMVAGQHSGVRGSRKDKKEKSTMGRDGVLPIRDRARKGKPARFRGSILQVSFLPVMREHELNYESS